MSINYGDKIGIIALSGNCEPEKIKLAVKNLEQMGYQVELSKNIYEQKNYLAGSDEDKVQELHRFFEDPDIKLILAARGGYGAIRLINHIDYEIIKNNPKPFCGFSDVTALLLMIYKKTGIQTFHSPMACSDFGMENISDFSIKQFFKTINSNHHEFIGKNSYFEGNANGILWGGNLSTVVSLCGQDFLPNKDFIFFTEDLNEPVYKIDKMFQQLINISEFKTNCKGIILGDFLNIDNEIWLDDLFEELASQLGIPVISGFKITHDTDKITLPIGANSKIEGLKLLY